MQKYISLLLLLSGLSVSLFSQQNSYEPIENNTRTYNRYAKKMVKRYEKDVESLPEKYNKQLKRAYRDRFEMTQRKLFEGHFLFQDTLNQYFNNILSTILDNNPTIKNKRDIKLFIGRYYWPNASCLGEGSLIFNIGLLRRLENESQAAFVIAHELAHYSLNHVNDKIHQRIHKLNSAKAKRLAREVRRGLYNANQNADEFLKDVVYNDRHHSRTFEKAADSLAIVMLQNTPYNLSEGKRTLEILDSIDAEKYSYPLKIKERFDSPDYPFKNRWLMKEQGLSMKKVDDFAWNTDSLKTHPDCQKRISALNNMISTNQTSLPKNVQDLMTFDDIIRLADFEMVASSFELGDYGRSLYYCLQLLQDYPDNAWLNAMIGICFYDIYVAQEEHTLGRHLDLPSNDFKDDYRELLQFVHNLRLKDIANISYDYIHNNKAAFLEDEHYLYALVLVADLMGYDDEIATNKKTYISKFKLGRYRTHLKEF